MVGWLVTPSSTSGIAKAHAAMGQTEVDRIDTWDYIDRSAPRVVGLFLLDRPRDVLFDLARSEDRWHRRAAVVAAYTINRAGDLDDPLALCAILAADPERLVQTALGVALREIGRVDADRLRVFLDRYGAGLLAPRPAEPPGRGSTSVPGADPVPNHAVSWRSAADGHEFAVFAAAERQRFAPPTTPCPPVRAPPRAAWPRSLHAAH